jgi:erythromycin esterase
MRNKVALTLVIFFLGVIRVSAYGGSDRNDKSKVEWLKKHTVAVRSIDAADADLSDLMPLRKAIGEARVVLLGEQSHGDGATFYAKRRLIRFLHEKMGFDVLAWESGLYDCQKVEEALHSDLPPADAVAKGIFGIWSVSNEVFPLFDYVRSTYTTEHPLITAGFDDQFTARKTAETYGQDLQAFFDRVQPGALTPEDRKTIDDLVPALLKKYEPTPEQREAPRAVLEKALSVLAAASIPQSMQREAEFYQRTLENFLTLEEQAVPGASSSTRDIRMGENLLWLMEKRYPGKKIIVWAASLHIMRNAPMVDDAHKWGYDTMKVMGDVAYAKLGAKMYSIAFVAYQGKAGRVNQPAPWDIGVAKPESLEAHWHETGRAYGFLDLRTIPPGDWLRKPFSARPLGHAAMTSTWGNNFDGIFFTDTMVPATRQPPSKPPS